MVVVLPCINKISHLASLNRKGMRKPTYSIDMSNDANIAYISRISFIVRSLGCHMSPTLCCSCIGGCILTTMRPSNGNLAEENEEPFRLPCLAPRKARRQGHLSSFDNESLKTED